MSKTQTLAAASCNVLVRHALNPTSSAQINPIVGFLFRSYPVLMTNENSAELMDSVFASPDLDLRARLLRIIQDFLMSESSKFMAQEKGD